MNCLYLTYEDSFIPNDSKSNQTENKAKSTTIQNILYKRLTKTWNINEMMFIHLINLNM